jgi:hypothetical protein
MPGHHGPVSGDNTMKFGIGQPVPRNLCFLKGIGRYVADIMQTCHVLRSPHA